MFMAYAWVLTAESSRARFYAVEGRSAGLVEVEDLLHERGRLHEGDLVSDKPGSDGGRPGQSHHALNARFSAHQHETDSFAKEIAARLHAAHRQRKFDHLILIAAPAFLGQLRSHLDKPLIEVVIEEIDKNLVRQSATQVRAHIKQLRPIKEKNSR